MNNTVTSLFPAVSVRSLTALKRREEKEKSFHFQTFLDVEEDTNDVQTPPDPSDEVFGFVPEVYFFVFLKYGAGLLPGLLTPWMLDFSFCLQPSN